MMKQITKFIGLSGQCSRCRPRPFLRGLIGTSILACLSIGMGCATQTPPPAEYPAMNAEHARDLAFRYRGEALALSKLADGLELEANSVSAHAQRSGSTTVADSRIHDLRKQAEAAFEQARRYRDQVPHNQMY